MAAGAAPAPAAAFVVVTTLTPVVVAVGLYPLLLLVAAPPPFTPGGGLLLRAQRLEDAHRTSGARQHSQAQSARAQKQKRTCCCTAPAKVRQAGQGLSVHHGTPCHLSPIQPLRIGTGLRDQGAELAQGDDRDDHGHSCRDPYRPLQRPLLLARAV
jgi:hypothetical protein